MLGEGNGGSGGNRLVSTEESRGIVDCEALVGYNVGFVL